MRRREFIAGLAGAGTWPLAARAQQGERVRRIVVLMGWSESDSEPRSWLAAFIKELARLGRVDGRNVQIDQRWTNGDFDRARILAKELMELRPDVILSGAAATVALQRETSTTPIVFALLNDPVGLGFVSSLPRPGGNLTGFVEIEGEMIGKWLEMIKEVAPSLTRAAAMYHPDTAPYAKYFLGPFEAAAKALAMEPRVVPVRDDAEIEMAINSLGREQSALIVLPDAFMTTHRATIIAAATRNHVPTIYDNPFFPRDGGLLSYGPNFPAMFRGAAAYVDRVLKGEKTTDLPVQAPTRFDLVINLKTAKALGLTVPQSILLRADEVIE
jgi:putative ABC transport system substrate-binding protein